MSPAKFTWEWLATQIATGFDKWYGRWTNVWINLVLLAMFVPMAAFLKEGWVRDLWWFAAGTFAGYTLMWLASPRFNRARKAEMEAEMATMMAGLYDRINRHSIDFEKMMLKADDEKPGRLQ